MNSGGVFTGGKSRPVCSKDEPLGRKEVVGRLLMGPGAYGFGTHPFAASGLLAAVPYVTLRC